MKIILYILYLLHRRSCHFIRKIRGTPCNLRPRKERKRAEAILFAVLFSLKAETFKVGLYLRFVRLSFHETGWARPTREPRSNLGN